MDFLGPDPELRGAPGYGAPGGEAGGATDARPYRDGFWYGDAAHLTDEHPAEPSAGGYGAGGATLAGGASSATFADGASGATLAGRASSATLADGAGGATLAGRASSATLADGAGGATLAGGASAATLPFGPSSATLPFGAGGATLASGQLGDGEVLESGPERPRGGVDWLARDLRRWWRGVGSATPWRRRAIAATAALAAAGVLVALRAGAPTVPLEEAAAADAASAPVIIYGRARLQPPPFDRLPGRTPIPSPSPIGRPAEAVRGALPATGALGEEAARDAARLVVGRYCRFPRAYQVRLEPTRSWHEVTATVLHRTYLGPRRLTTLQLRWTGHTYSWQGRPTELAHCA